MTHPLYQMIAQGEHLQQDFKFEISDIGKIARSLSAFANTQGGRLLVGVKDNGKIAGIESDEEAYMIEAAGSRYCSPAVECRIESLRAEGKTVLVAHVPPSPKRPVCALQPDGRKTAYVRVADENIVATPVHLRLWQSESRPGGELLHFTERERGLLRLLGDEPQGATLNRLGRKSSMGRRELVAHLAQFIRYGLVQMEFCDHRFVYRAAEGAER